MHVYSDVGDNRSSQKQHELKYGEYYSSLFDENDYHDFDSNSYLEEDFVHFDGGQVSGKEVLTASVSVRKPKSRKSAAAPSISTSTENDDNSNQQHVDILALTMPIVPISVSLDQQTGDEFSNPENLDLLVASGLDIVNDNGNDNGWIEWKMHDATKKLLKDHSEREVLEQGDVLVHIGTAKQEGHGSSLPIIKTKSILPLSAEEMADLLMDSSKVKIYNKLSLGRTDVKILGETTKVVCNRTKPPIAKSEMISCTLMHCRKLWTISNNNDPESSPRDSYIVVSRAMPGMIDAELSELPRNDILLGVNLLEDIGPNKCIMTAVTHVYSPALPTMLAKGMGVSSAINFVKDIRKSREGVTH
jgi:hypothetical protein